jgi:hypothetical protein
MKIIYIFVLIVSLAFVTQISAKQDKQENQKDSKTHFSLNLKKGFSCHLAYNAVVDFNQVGQSTGMGRWKIYADLLLECADISEDGIMTVSQSPLKVYVEGTKIEGKYEIDFNSPEENLRIPEMLRGYLLGLVKVKSVKFDKDGKIIAARQSPGQDDYIFMAMGKISYEKNPEWILPDNPENTETVNNIARLIIGLFPDILGKEITIGKTITITRTLPQSDKDVLTKHLTVKAIKNNKAQLELKSNFNSERKTPNEFVDEVHQFSSTEDGIAQVDINTGIVFKYQSKTEADFRVMTFIPLISSRVPTMSNNREINCSYEIIEN